MNLSRHWVGYKQLLWGFAVCRHVFAEAGIQKDCLKKDQAALSLCFVCQNDNFFRLDSHFFFTEYPGRFFNVETNERIYLCEFNQSCYILYQTYSRIASLDFWLFLVWYQYHSVLFLLEVYVPNRFSLLSFLSFSPAETRVHIKHNL